MFLSFVKQCRSILLTECIYIDMFEKASNELYYQIPSNNFEGCMYLRKNMAYQ